MREYKHIWCNECGDIWSVKPFVCEEEGDPAPRCEYCESEDTEPSGEGEEVE